MKQSGLKVSFYLKKSEMSDDGLCPVMGRINVGRYSEAAFSAKLSASPKAWMLGRATGKSAASREINRQLDEIRASALSVYQELSAVRMGVTADDVKCQIQGHGFRTGNADGIFQNVHRELRKACRCEPGSWHTEILQLHLQMPGGIFGNGIQAVGHSVYSYRPFLHRQV